MEYYEPLNESKEESNTFNKAVKVAENICDRSGTLYGTTLDEHVKVIQNIGVELALRIEKEYPAKSDMEGLATEVTSVFRDIADVRLAGVNTIGKVENTIRETAVAYGVLSGFTNQLSTYKR